MNIKEWQKACEDGYAPRRYDNASREIQRSLKYNNDPKATVHHHLRDTEEQRKYNDEHYELWGFEIDKNGNEHFEYGKYIIFVTKEEHVEIHKCSEETREKLSGKNNGMYGKHHSEEAKKKMSENNSGEKIRCTEKEVYWHLVTGDAAKHIQCTEKLVHLKESIIQMNQNKK